MENIISIQKKIIASVLGGLIILTSIAMLGLSKADAATGETWKPDKLDADHTLAEFTLHHWVKGSDILKGSNFEEEYHSKDTGITLNLKGELNMLQKEELEKNSVKVDPNKEYKMKSIFYVDITGTYVYSEDISYEAVSRSAK